jgi:GNAT superfamily N-acetyltransferase
MSTAKKREPFELRPLTDENAMEYGDLLFSAFNAWWWKHGLCKDFYECSPTETSIFYYIYNDMSPGCSIAAFHTETGRMMGACFYHPREHHVSLGIMAVHPNYSGNGVARVLVDYILDYTRKNGFKACRLVNSAMNLDSFSLYNRSGFVPREMYQDMMINVPEEGLQASPVPGMEHVRDAVPEDIGRMGDLEFEIGGIRREVDYRYGIENPRKVMHAIVFENTSGEIEGFLVSLKHPALNILGPCVAKDEETALALLRSDINRFSGTWALFVVPMQKRKIVEQLYGWKAFNVETHVKQVYGEFQPYRGV